ncbi:hypothetical protein ACFU0X_20500 [Streptomyces cellulosae]|uniref:Uncharacterized protein n=1 Tax=Streptomyces cellulosae TaxID=1968 RepID=A0ABW6JLW4_STRCE
MILPPQFDMDRRSDMALFALRNSANLDVALTELAESLVPERGQRDAYKAVGDALWRAADLPGGFTFGRQLELRRLAGDLYRLVGLDMTGQAPMQSIMDSVPEWRRRQMRQAVDQLREEIAADPRP